MSATEIQTKSQVISTLITALAKRFEGTPITILAYEQGIVIDRFKITVSEMEQ